MALNPKCFDLGTIAIQCRDKMLTQFKIINKQIFLSNVKVISGIYVFLFYVFRFRAQSPSL